MRRAFLAVLAMAAAIGSERAEAAGFYLYETGAPSVGLASAGYAARASDAETLFTNPAGLTRLGKMELLVGGQALYGSATLSPSSLTAVPGGGNDGGNAIGWLPGGSLFFAMEVAPRLRIGFGALQYFGLGLEYDPGWAGRYYGQKGALIGLSLVPGAAYRVADWLSVGAGLNAMFGVLRSDVAVNNVAPGLGDGQVSMSDNAWGFGADVGLLFELGKATRIGLTWLSAVSLGFKTVPSYRNLGPGLQAALGAAGLLDAPVGLGVTAPNRIMAGLHQELSPQWALMGDVGWESWSQFGKVEVSIGTPNPVGLTTSVAYQDTWHVAVGAQFLPSEEWTLSAGFAYDSSMMADDARTVLTPVGAAYRYALGAQWSLSRSVQLGLDDTFIWGGTLPLHQDRGPLAGVVDGSYPDTFVNVVALNLRWLMD